MWVVTGKDGRMHPIPHAIDDAIFELLRSHAARRLAEPGRPKRQAVAMHNLRESIERALTNAINGDPLDADPSAVLVDVPAKPLQLTCKHCGKEHTEFVPDVCTVCGAAMNVDRWRHPIIPRGVR